MSDAGAVGDTKSKRALSNFYSHYVPVSSVFFFFFFQTLQTPESSKHIKEIAPSLQTTIISVCTIKIRLAFDLVVILSQPCQGEKVFTC